MFTVAKAILEVLTGLQELNVITQRLITVLGTAAVKLAHERKTKWTCIAPIVSTRPLSAQMWITQCYLQIHHICLSFV